MEYAAIKSYVGKLLFQIQTEINISNSDECIGIDRALHMMRFIRPLCDELRKYTVNYQFRDEAEEIYFFKELKPEVLSKYMYYNKIYVIESKFPTGSDVAQKEYLYKELNSLTFYFSRNLDFYQYYRSKSTYLDRYYFTRNQNDLRICTDSSHIDKDPLYSEANGDFNKGTATLKEIAGYLEHMFSIDVGNLHHSYLTFLHRQHDFEVKLPKASCGTGNRFVCRKSHLAAI